MSVQIISGYDKTKNLSQNIIANRHLPDNDVFLSQDDLQDPQEMKGAVEAAHRISQAIDKNEKIVLYSDYDCDGWGCCVVFDGIMKIVGYTNYLLKSNKREEGYGMNIAGLEQVLTEHPDVKLVVTADNGILCFSQALWLADRGIDLIVTDHHLPAADGTLPAAVAVVDPHRLDDTSYKNLCGTGVLYKMLLLLLSERGIRQEEADSLLDIVGTATVADVVPLVGENRWYTQKALRMMTDEVRPQWTMFKALSGSRKPIIEFLSYNIGFYVGPCINAVSRTTGDIQPAVQIFTQNMPGNIKYLVDVNEDRKAAQREKSAQAMNLLGSNPPDRCICVQSPGCGDGIIGLVAGDINTRYYRPSIVFTLNKKRQWKGSCRSIPGVHMKEMLDYVNEKDPTVIVQYGGHAQAAGLTVNFLKFNRFAALCNEYCNALPAEIFERKVVYDYELTAFDDMGRIWAERKSLEPFGCDFPEPVFLVRGKVSKAFVPKNGLHLFMQVGNFPVACFNINDMMNGYKAADIKTFTGLCTMSDSNQFIAMLETVELGF